MRVAIHFGDSIPQNGGAHVYLVDLLKAFGKLARNSTHEFMILADRNDVQTIGLLLDAPNVMVVPVRRPSRFGRRMISLKYWWPLLRRLWRRPGSVERAALQHGAQLMWFVGSVYYEPPDIPFVATMLDLQHRFQPFFPEVSARAEWDAREQFFASTLRRATYCVTGTEAGKKEIEFLYQVASPRIRVLPLPTPSFALDAGKDPPDVDVKNLLGIDREYVFYPAQFWPHKNHANLILALKRLREQRGIDLALALTGCDKGNLSFVRDFAFRQGMADRVRLLGFVSEQEMVALYRNAVALTYVTYFGPDNIPPLEAFALGCPVIASSVTGAKEQYGDAVIQVDPSDPEEISAAIWKVYSDEEFRKTLVEAGRQRARKWTSTDYVMSMFDLFDEFSAVRRNWA